ncbi:E3 ubiquitin-protein ligase RNF123 [Elysia marginata]|uniref:E3 ubiquitin-protein ligase RNF123 n=1 Tax=Elysia marginata TaxID=1093978 RepID=A0AAV4GY76_9GAST|nr:E3 ubiquitin-protein ligase RNF123 [Elysia marginata]
MAESKRSGEAFRDTSPNTRPADNSDGLRLRRSQRNAIEQSQPPPQGSAEDTFILESLKEVTNNELKASCRGGDLQAAQLPHPHQIQQSEVEGRLGPAESTFDVLTSVGILLLDPDKLGITSHSNFSSIKGNCCVYEGKWVYELMLVSKGVMQLGWCTSKCRFTQEPWMSGDVISCAIDCDEGTISFYRNGIFLGEAFDKLRMGPGYAYFPARVPYVVEMCLVKFMLGLCDHDNWEDHQSYIHKLLDLLWMLMQDQEMQECMDNLTVSLLNGYSFHSFHPEFKFPKKFLALTLSVLRHQRTRRYLLTSVLYPSLL